MNQKPGMPNFRMPSEIGYLKKHIKAIVIGFFGLILFWSSWFTVGPEEVGVVMRFGEFQREVSPGLNFKIPFGFESVQKVPVERQLKQEFGYRTAGAGSATRYSSENFSHESLMLTGDLNLADVEWVVQYRISDPYKFLFRVRNPEKTLRDISEAVMRQVVGDRTVDEVLTVGRQEVATQVELLLQEICDEYENGITIDQVVLQDVNPPEPVKDSFNAVNEAQQEREKLVNEALTEFNRVVPRARGEALQTIQNAEGYALERVNRAEGDATRFNQLYNEYIKAPDVTKRRIYLETMNTILPKIGNKIVVDDNGQNVVPLLQMGGLNVKSGAQQ